MHPAAAPVQPAADLPPATFPHGLRPAAPVAAGPARLPPAAVRALRRARPAAGRVHRPAVPPRREAPSAAQAAVPVRAATAAVGVQVAAAAAAASAAAVAVVAAAVAALVVAAAAAVGEEEGADEIHCKTQHFSLPDMKTSKKTLTGTASNACLCLLEMAAWMLALALVLPIARRAADTARPLRHPMRRCRRSSSPPARKAGADFGPSSGPRRPSCRIRTGSRHQRVPGLHGRVQPDQPARPGVRLQIRARSGRPTRGRSRFRS